MDKHVHMAHVVAPRSHGLMEASVNARERVKSPHKAESFFAGPQREAQTRKRKARGSATATLGLLGSLGDSRSEQLLSPGIWGRVFLGNFRCSFSDLP